MLYQLSYTPKAGERIPLAPRLAERKGSLRRASGGGSGQAAASFLLWPSIALTVVPVTGLENI
jgi:hypothetical protein